MDFDVFTRFVTASLGHCIGECLTGRLVSITQAVDYQLSIFIQIVNRHDITAEMRYVYELCAVALARN